MPQVATPTAKRKTLVVLAAAAALVLMAVTVVFWFTSKLKPVAPRSEELVAVRIPSGSSTSEVAQLLHQRQLIKDPVAFRYYARLTGLDGKLQPGEYELSGAMKVKTMLKKLASGDVLVRRFTIPEGLTVEQMADLLAERDLVDPDRFLDLTVLSDLADEYLPEGVRLTQPLEGYLFPATYEYEPGITEEEIIQMMFDRFQQVWTPERRQQAEQLGMSIHEVMVLASIVEREAQAPAERPVIAGVYHNRLRIGMKLDADPTVCYALHLPADEELRGYHLRVESPYNTYLNPGLPPGPIAAPGEASIDAVLNPASHNYWYFVAKQDGSGEHYFSETLEEQGENIEKAEANLHP